MEKITMFGTGTAILKAEPVREVPVDRALRTIKHVGSCNVNPSKKDCIAWTDKKTGQLVFREDFEKEQYNKYVKAIQDSQGETETLSFNDYKEYALWA